MSAFPDRFSAAVYFAGKFHRFISEHNPVRDIESSLLCALHVSPDMFFLDLVFLCMQEKKNSLCWFLYLCNA